MYNVCVMGAGKIGSLISCLLAISEDYRVHLADINFSGQDVQRLLKFVPDIQTATVDMRDDAALKALLDEHPFDAVISSLPYYLNTPIAELARERGLHYFDLTEDTTVTKVVRELANGADSAFVPQCGLAPGFVSIVANGLMKDFDVLETAKLRVGALPQYTSNALNYALTWSTEGIINELGNPCSAIEQGELVSLSPLEGLEEVQLDGLTYEAFNTSGGLGSLAESYLNRIQNLSYKTLRYPGHCEKMRFLMNDLKLNQDRAMMQKLLENAIPKTYQDVVLIYVAVTGYYRDTYLEKTYVKKIYPQEIKGKQWSAIQVTTASSACAVVDMVLSRADEFRGLVLQEQFSLENFFQNRFATCYQ